MHGFNLSSFALLLLSVAPSLALPTVKEASLAPRTRFCANSPHTVAGTTLTHRSPLPEILQPRRGTEPIIWCAAGGETYIFLTMAYELAGNAIPSVLTAAYNEILTGVILHGDSVIPGGMFQKSGTGNAVLRIMNSNNHQLTYGVLGAAILALQGYMSDFSFGVASFTINDGMIEIAKGVIGIE